MTSLRRIALLAVLMLAAAAGVRAQDITPYTLRSGEEDIFQREVAAALARAPMDDRLPKLGCTVEYLRRLDGDEIVYRRGPIDMHQHGGMGTLNAPDASLSGGTRPISPDDAASSYFTGGILVDLPRPGESSESQALLPAPYRYMLRVALIPQAYEDGTMTALVYLERAVVRESGEDLELYRSEVFSRTVELDGNLPLKFDLPEWDSSLPGGGAAVPARLREGVLLTLETPHQFSMPGSFPQPFRERARLTYAVPQTSTIRLTIQVRGEERVIDEGVRTPGTYDVVWNADDLPEDRYTATFTATDDDGRTLFSDRHTLVKQRDAESWQPEPVTVLHRDGSRRFVFSTESGIAYQLPGDNARALRNMFTHVVFRLGYRITRSLELGLVVGQDAFHEKPGPEVDVDRIADYGGVVGYTYGYAGPYLRWLMGSRTVQPFLQISAAFTDSAPLAETAFGIRVQVFRQVDLYLAPAALVHLRDKTSTKLGIHYGMQVQF